MHLPDNFIPKFDAKEFQGSEELRFWFETSAIIALSRNDSREPNSIG